MEQFQGNEERIKEDEVFAVLTRGCLAHSKGPLNGQNGQGYKGTGGQFQLCDGLFLNLLRTLFSISLFGVGWRVNNDP